MANVFTTFATAQTDGALTPSSRPSQAGVGGSLYCVQVKKEAYTAATADPLYLIKMPVGVLFFPQLSWVTYTDPGDACTGSLGTFTTADTPVVIDADAFGAGLALGGSAGNANLGAATTIGVQTITPVRTTQDTWLVMTWTTVTNGASHAQYYNLVFG